MLDIRIARPVVVVGIGRVAVAAIWEESQILSGTIENFEADVRTAIREILVKLEEDWQQDNLTP